MIWGYLPNYVCFFGKTINGVIHILASHTRYFMFASKDKLN